MICLVSDIQALKAKPGRKAVGSVLEAKLDRGRGAWPPCWCRTAPCAINDSYIVGNTFGKVRAMFDDRGTRSKKPARPRRSKCSASKPCRDAGDTFLVVADRDKAKGIAQYRKMKEREARSPRVRASRSKAWQSRFEPPAMKDLTLIIKGDVQGSVEVLADLLASCPPRR